MSDPVEELIKYLKAVDEYSPTARRLVAAIRSESAGTGLDATVRAALDRVWETRTGPGISFDLAVVELIAAIRAESAGTPSDCDPALSDEDVVSMVRALAQSPCPYTRGEANLIRAFVAREAAIRAESAGTRTYTQEQHDESERQLRDCHDRLARAESAGTGLDVDPERLAQALHDSAIPGHNLGEGPARAICTSGHAHRRRADDILARLSSSDTERSRDEWLKEVEE